MNKPLIFCEHEGDKNSYESYAETIYDDRIVPLIHIDFFNMADKIVRTENFNHVVKKLSQREPGKRGGTREGAGRKPAKKVGAKNKKL
jgi:hypothetical protein